VAKSSAGLWIALGALLAGGAVVAVGGGKKKPKKKKKPTPSPAPKPTPAPAPAPAPAPQPGPEWLDGASVTIKTVVPADQPAPLVVVVVSAPQTVNDWLPLLPLDAPVRYAFVAAGPAKGPRAFPAYLSGGPLKLDLGIGRPRFTVGNANNEYLWVWTRDILQEKAAHLDQFGAVDFDLGALVTRIREKFPTTRTGIVGYGRGATAVLMSAWQYQLGPAVSEILVAAPVFDGASPAMFVPKGGGVDPQHVVWVHGLFAENTPADLAYAEYQDFVMTRPETSTFVPVLAGDDWSAMRLELEGRIPSMLAALTA
jgi:hypothetical protein